MEIKHFRLIRTIADEGSIANSSEKLFLTQSALSHQLRELEERLGFKVFNRSRNQWRLTVQGDELYKLAVSVLDSIDDGFKNIELINQGSKGRIRISTECCSLYMRLPRFIQKMGMLYPHIDIEMIHDVSQPISKLVSNETDIAIVASNENTNDLTYLEIYSEELFAVMHKEHELADKSFVLPDDFANVHLLVNCLPLETIYVYQHFLRTNSIMPKKISAVPMTEIIMEMIQANMGIVCLPMRTLDSFKYSKEIIVRPIGEKGLRRMHHMAVRTEDKSKQFIHDFISMIKEEFVDEI